MSETPDGSTPVDPSRDDRTPMDGLPPGFLAVEDPLVGTVVAERYRVERVLGEGGMGRVYEVSDTTFHKRLVLKTLFPQVGQLKGSWERFLREARAAAGVGGPNIVGVSDFGGLPDGRSFYVMELVDGVTLDAALDGLNAPMPVARALDIARGIAHAIGAAHEAGVVHRDLKPDNVILCVRHGRSDFVKVLDFGLAFMLDGGARLTAQGELVGTPYYMAPEQCSDRPVDHRADIYALGVILYEMLTLELPIDSTSFAEVLRKKLTDDPKPPSTLEKCGHIPAEVDELVSKAIARLPDDRFESVDAMLLAIEAIAGPQSSGDAFTIAAGEAATMPDSASVAPPALDPTPTPVEAVPKPIAPTSSTDLPAFKRAPSSTSSAPPALVAERPRWPLLLAVAVVLTVLASAAFGWVLAHQDETTDPDDVSAVEGAEPEIEVVTPSDDATEPLPPNVYLDSTPSGATVSYGERVIGQTPIRIATPALGVTRELILRAPGHPPRTYVLGAYSASEVTVDLSAPMPTRRSAGRGAPEPTAPAVEAPIEAPAEEEPAQEPTPASEGSLMNPWNGPAEALGEP